MSPPWAFAGHAAEKNNADLALVGHSKGFTKIVKI